MDKIMNREINLEFGTRSVYTIDSDNVDVRP